MKAHGGYGCKGPHITAMALGRSGVASPMLNLVDPKESPWYSFYRRLNGSLDQSGHEGAKKYLHPCDIRDGTEGGQPLAK